MARSTKTIHVVNKYASAYCQGQLQLAQLVVMSLTRKLCYRKDDRTMRTIQVDREPLRRYGHSKLSKMAAAAILNLFKSKIAPLDLPSPKAPP